MKVDPLGQEDAVQEDEPAIEYDPVLQGVHEVAIVPPA
jgi:hypothetical protein